MLIILFFYSQKLDLYKITIKYFKIFSKQFGSSKENSNYSMIKKYLPFLTTKLK